MHNGESPPFISQENVRAALDSLVYVSAARAPNPLEYLLLIDELLIDPDFPSSPHSRAFALSHLLINTIQQEYQRVRAQFGQILPPGDAVSVEAALAELRADERCGGPDLIGWGLLYFRYRHSALGLSLDTLGQALHADPRTLRRYQNYAVRKLTEQLTLKEWAARKRQRKRRLLSELPAVTRPLLFGREALLQEIQGLLLQDSSHCIYVTGTTGAGKSALVQEILREHIERDMLDCLVWIQQPTTVEFVRRRLIERLLPQGTRVSLREYLLLYRVGVVLDSIESLHQQRTDLEHLLDELSSALVFLTSRLVFPLRSITRHIVLGELDENGSVALIRSTGGGHLTESAVSKVYQATGGNPLAIKLALQTPSLASIPGELYAPVYLQLDKHVRQVWFMFALVPPGPTSPSTFRKIWPERIRESDVASLAQHYLIDAVSPENDLYALTPSGRNFIEQLYANDPEVKQAIHELLDEIKVDFLTAVLNVIEHVLLSDWLEIDGEQRYLWMMSAWREGVRQGQCASWCSVFERFIHDHNSRNKEVLTAYGICLRRLCQWTEAERAFQSVVWLTGQEGAFLEQAEALLELSIIHRYWGHYERAIHLMNQVEAALAPHMNGELADRLRLEQAATAIDTGDFRHALSVLSAVRRVSFHHSLLLSEAYLLAGNRRQCLDLAHKALEMAEHASGLEARAHAVIGRCYAEHSDLPLARHHLGLAVVLLERDNEPVALARAQSNLSTILLESGDYEEAEFLLRRANQVQTQLRDRLGLTATQHNLSLLTIARFHSQS